MAISLIAHSTGVAPAGSPGNSATINSTGATLLVVVIGDAQIGVESVSDSNGNTWNALTPQGSGSSGNSIRSQIFYAYAKGSVVLSLGSGHFVTVSGAFSAFSFSAWSGTLTYPTNPFDSENGTTSGSSTLQPGSITPLLNNELVITGCGSQASSGADAISTGYTILDTLPLAGGSNYDMGSAYQIQTVATATNPTWTTSGSFPGATIACFKAAVTAFTANYSETFTIIDVLKRSISTKYTEVITLVETFKRATSIKLTEVFTLLDSINRAISIRFAIVFSLVETFFIGAVIPISITFNEVINLVDAIKWSTPWDYIRGFLSDPLIITGITSPTPNQPTNSEDLDYFKKYL